MQPLTLLLTGASGFVGSYVSAALTSANDRLRLVSWDRARFGDLRDRAARNVMWEEVQPNIVVHLAWESTELPDYDRSPQNAVWAEASAQFAKESIARATWFVVAGSAADVPNDSRFSSPYSNAKRRLRADLKTLEGEITLFSPQFLFSLADRRPRLLRAFMDAGAPSNFRVRNPDQRWDFIHIDDLATAVAAIIEHRLTGSVYVGSGVLRSPQDLVHAAYASLNGISVADSSSTWLRSPQLPDALTAVGWLPRVTDAFFTT